MKTKVAIIGGGPSGIATAITLKQLGIDSIMFEREQFPRFHVGESMTGECGASVRALGLEERMATDGHPIKYGTMVYGANGANSFYVPVMGRDENNMMFKQTTWQVRRSTFDKMMEEVAKDLGLKHINARVVSVIKGDEEGKLDGLRYRTEDGEEHEVEADVVVDCSGQNTFLASQNIASKRTIGNYGKQVAMFSHFKGCKRPEVGEDGDLQPDDTIIFYQKKDHWAWFIPLDDEVVSIGIVTPSDYFKSCKESKEEFIKREMKSLNSKLSERMQNAEMIEEPRACANYSYQVHDFVGKNWLCVGDAHRFIDPIFSLGLHFSLAEGRKAADAIKEYLTNEDVAAMDSPFEEHKNTCETGMDNIQDMLDGFWDYPLAFSLYLKDKRYRDNFIDMFAGRVYTTEPSEGILALRRLNKEGTAKVS